MDRESERERDGEKRKWIEREKKKERGRGIALYQVDVEVELRWKVQHSTVQHNTTQRCTAQYSAAPAPRLTANPAELLSSTEGRSFSASAFSRRDVTSHRTADSFAGPPAYRGRGREGRMGKEGG